MCHLQANPKVATEMNITKVGEDSSGNKNPLSFVAQVVLADGAKSEMCFTMKPGQTYVLYVKAGSSTMACVKLLKQFKQEAQFHEKIDPQKRLQIDIKDISKKQLKDDDGFSISKTGAPVDWARFEDPRGIIAHLQSNADAQARLHHFDPMIQDAITWLSEKRQLLGPMIQDAIKQEARLNDDELLGIFLYSYDSNSGTQDGNLFFEENKDLRAQHMENIEKCWGTHICYLMNGMRKLDDVKATVYRGLQGECVNQFKQYKVKDSMTFNSWTSTAMNKDQATQFMGNNGEGLLLRMSVRTGKDISKLAQLYDETETLLLPNHKFSVTQDVHKEDGLYVMDLNEAD